MLIWQVDLSSDNNNHRKFIIAKDRSMDGRSNTSNSIVSFNFAFGRYTKFCLELIC